MPAPLLTIGMAVIRDFHGPYFTIQATRLNDAALMDRVEFVVVDQDPENEHGKELKNFVENWAGVGNCGARYVAMPEMRGTTQPRQRVFDEASGDWVLVVDSHVLLADGALQSLVDWIERNPDSGNLIQGPILYDDLQTVSTEFVPGFRGEMWGMWHTDPRGTLATNPPYEIWAQGLGLFAARRDKWPGFDRRWRGFGGEEGCIHGVFRQRGDKCLCLPALRWGHRFAKPGVSSYLVPTWQKVRNYVLGFQRLNLELEPIRAHFVDQSKKMTADQWTALLADPEREVEPGMVSYPEPVAPTDFRPSRASAWPMPQDISSLDSIFDFLERTPRDLNEHAKTLREFAHGQGVVVELTKRRESTAFLLAGRPEVLVSFQREPDALIDVLHHVVKATNPLPIKEFTTHEGDTLDVVIPKCDVLFVDSIHSGPRILQELRRHGPSVAKKIAIRGTAVFGDAAENGQEPGLYFGIEEWFEEELKREVPRSWVRVFRADNQYGLSIYSCEPGAVSVDTGPGTELSAILRKLGIVSSSACDCRAKAATMDQWGVAGCRERREQIVDWIKEGAPRWGWAERLKAGAMAVISGIAFQIDPLNPYASLVDLAIERAAQKGGK